MVVSLINRIILAMFTQNKQKLRSMSSIINLLIDRATGEYVTARIILGFRAALSVHMSRFQKMVAGIPRENVFREVLKCLKCSEMQLRTRVGMRSMQCWFRSVLLHRAHGQHTNIRQVLMMELSNRGPHRR